MKKYLPLLILLFGVFSVASKLFIPATSAGSFDLTAFGRLPVLVNGRIKPLDTVARTTLLVLQNRQRVSDPTISEPLVASPTEWLADVLFAPAKADNYPTFRLSTSESPELVTLMGLTDEQIKISYDSAILRTLAFADFVPKVRSRFSYNQLAPKLAELERQAQLADPVDAQLRTSFQKAVVQLSERIVLYQRLKHSLQLPDSPDFLAELGQFQKALPAGVEAVRARQRNEPHDEVAFKAMIEMAKRYEVMDNFGYLLAIPPADSEPSPTAWKKAGGALLETFATGSVNPSVMAYAGLGHAWREKQPGQFNEITRLYREQLGKRFGTPLHKSDIETRFNAAELFYKSMTLYAMAFFLAIFSWLKWPDELGRSAFYLTLLAFVVTTAGIVTRMWLEGRPPVTNLYSSALFVGWGSVGLCLILEKIYRNAVGSVAAGMIGFATLLIAHHLSLSGDTLEMMRAVLDTNLWLATHVVVVTTGYAATFLAGFLAIIYVLRGVLTRSLDKPTADALARMVYGIVCFATLCSLVGTVLGGIWADQSWGRFWGWDPKENGALIIVIWNAIILHCRWGGLVRQRGLMCLAIFGNVVTSWSWFGVNMLGVGLHSYGFMDSAFYWLVAFVSSQLFLIVLASLPLEKWRSFGARTVAT
jgi:ABC-type transport system involved in cytochrome c biogenesis permease subunit